MIIGNEIHKRVLREGSILLGGGPALLMQLGNPDVARDVRRISRYKTHPLDRLVGTLVSAYAVTFATSGTSERIQREVANIHRKVPGIRNTENIMWVHGTLVYNAINLFELTVRPLSDNEKEGVYQGMKPNGVAFGCPIDQQPEHWKDFLDWFQTQSQNFEVTYDAREVADVILFSRPPKPLRAFQPYNQLLSRGLIGDHFREGYGFDWTERDQEQLDTYLQHVHRIVDWTPGPLRASPAILLTTYAELQPAIRIANNFARSAADGFGRLGEKVFAG